MKRLGRSPGPNLDSDWPIESNVRKLWPNKVLGHIVWQFAHSFCVTREVPTHQTLGGSATLRPHQGSLQYSPSLQRVPNKHSFYNQSRDSPLWYESTPSYSQLRLWSHLLSLSSVRTICLSRSRSDFQLKFMSVN